MKIWDWLFKEGEDGVSPAMGMFFLGFLFIVTCLVGFIERG